MFCQIEIAPLEAKQNNNEMQLYKCDKLSTFYKSLKVMSFCSKEKKRKY